MATFGAIDVQAPESGCIHFVVTIQNLEKESVLLVIKLSIKLSMCKDCDEEFRKRVDAFCQEVNKLEAKYNLHIFGAVEGNDMTLVNKDEWQRGKDVDNALMWITQMYNEKYGKA